MGSTESVVRAGVSMGSATCTIGSAGVGWESNDKPWTTKRRRFVVYPASMPDGKFKVIKAAQAVDLGVFEVIRTF